MILIGIQWLRRKDFIMSRFCSCFDSGCNHSNFFLHFTHMNLDDVAFSFFMTCRDNRVMPMTHTCVYNSSHLYNFHYPLSKFYTNWFCYLSICDPRRCVQNIFLFFFGRNTVNKHFPFMSKVQTQCFFLNGPDNAYEEISFSILHIDTSYLNHTDHIESSYTSKMLICYTLLKWVAQHLPFSSLSW